MKDTVKVPWKAYILNAFCTVLIFVALSGMIEAKVIDKYIQGIIMLVFVNIILAVSLNLTTGFWDRLHWDMQVSCRLAHIPALSSPRQ